MKLATFTCLLLLAAASAVYAEEKDVTELKIETTHKPKKCSKKAKSGDKVSVHYTGKLVNGKQFDSSIPRGQPFDFVLGAGNVIKGWDEGIKGMCVGEKRILRIPPAMGYGDRGAGADIPGGATLIFETELVDVESDDDDYADPDEEEL
ncbi:hypothetical protein OEZ86_006521 [Tetradesmus obliquus]|uniref:Uncharacterized protein n=2 Tax=Tetradesmus obliquus TaxID=3088 RepID=A0ABY8TVT7_TETOB|nr:hypothetical protein OEZ85_006831 [Tetradesmus obliquus]WIA33385.1 hypothetical protein OEZ86_006521 [Tetradesmus obliquus]|eukprot:jgi/Sobl393_1/15246/SZX75114.1